MLPFGLSMLWESVDPHSALRERFGFDSLAAASDWVSDTLDRRWGIRVDGCSRLMISGGNAIAWVDGGLVVKWSAVVDRFDDLEASTRLLRVLSEKGLPVAAPVPTVDGLDRIVVDGLSVAVLPELNGQWLDVSDDRAVAAAGACLARLHEALGAIDTDVSQPAVSSRDRILGWLANDDHERAPEASRRLEALVKEADDLNGMVQLVHNDFRAANVLTRDSEIIGVLDFDETTVGYRVNDLAKACTYLGTLFTEWAPTPRKVQQAFRAGYESVRPLGPPEAQWLEIFLLWQGLLAIPALDTAGWAEAV